MRHDQTVSEAVRTCGSFRTLHGTVFMCHVAANRSGNCWISVMCSKMIWCLLLTVKRRSRSEECGKRIHLTNSAITVLMCKNRNPESENMDFIFWDYGFGWFVWGSALAWAVFRKFSQIRNSHFWLCPRTQNRNIKHKDFIIFVRGFWKKYITLHANYKVSIKYWRKTSSYIYI